MICELFEVNRIKVCPVLLILRSFAAWGLHFLFGGDMVFKGSTTGFMSSPGER